MKRASTYYTLFKKEIIKANESWLDYQSGQISFKSKYDFYALCYSMISGAATRWKLATRLVLDDMPQITSRTIQGFLDHPGTTTAFVSQLEWGEHKLSTQYKASTRFSLDVDQKELENISTGVVLIPHKDLYLQKVINTSEFQMFNDNTWQDFQSLSITKKLEKSSKVLILYNISLPGMQSHLVTRIDINTVPIEVNIITQLKPFLSNQGQLLEILCIGAFIIASFMSLKPM